MDEMVGRLKACKFEDIFKWCHSKIIGPGVSCVSRISNMCFFAQGFRFSQIIVLQNKGVLCFPPDCSRCAGL